MTYEALLQSIYSAHPELSGQLECESVRLDKRNGKAYVMLISGVLVGEKTFLSVEKIINRAFPRIRLSIRIASPALKEDFHRNLSAYRPLLLSFMSRNYPASSSWLEEIDWRLEDGVITLSFPDGFSLEYMERLGVKQRLRQAVYDIFRDDITVECCVKGDQEERIAAILRSRREADARLSSVLLTSETSAGPAVKPGRARSRTPGRAPHDKHLHGRITDQPPVPIRTLDIGLGRVTVEGDIISVDRKELAGGETLLLTLILTDYTSSVIGKLYLYYRSRYTKTPKGEDRSPITDEERAAAHSKADHFQEGMHIRVQGDCIYDKYERETVLQIRGAQRAPKKQRTDSAPQKRVELHAHTKMSAMDALTDPEALISRAARWGHQAIAITDHGVVQAFPAAFAAAKNHHIKLIPGCEAYLMEESDIITGHDGRALDMPVVALSFRTTGVHPVRDRIIDIGAVKIVNGITVDSLSMLTDPGISLKPEVTAHTGITDSMLSGQPSVSDGVRSLYRFMDGCSLAAFDAKFTYAILKSELQRAGIEAAYPQIDSAALARHLYPQLSGFTMKSVCRMLKVPCKDERRAINEALATARCMNHMLEALSLEGIHNFSELGESSQERVTGESAHIILLARDQTGIEHLNRIVSQAHLTFYKRKPNMPRSLLQDCREGLLVGSACESGELFRAAVRGESEERLLDIARFYDYLEIQPAANNGFLIRDGLVKDEEAIRDINRVIVALGDTLRLPVVAAGDVHFLEPEDAVYRAVLQDHQGYKDCDAQPPLYFRTTDEMLEEFAYLGAEKAYEVVVENPQRIAEYIRPDIRLFPKHPQNKTTFQPLLDEAKASVESQTWARAREWYGDTLPDIVAQRLNKELKAINKYEFATLYYIAQRLVASSVAGGFPVGSRGSVGSSLVATMCGITEVNPLPPHYRCLKCHEGFFDVDSRTYTVGADLPDLACPHCGADLQKDGYHIPFEVFLGFKGDKVPDIDLNFSGDYQSAAHRLVEDIFGEGHVYRAGTIGTIAEKTAYSYACKYLEKRDIIAGEAEKRRLAKGCDGVKHMTGQHPGGMVVLPKAFDIYSFTAIQHPADDPSSGVITTHYDFESMHDILVKLDILGHDDPTMIHELETLSGVHYTDIPLDDPQAMSLFSGPRALGVTEEDIGCATGTLGIPEFGTSFVRSMLEETKPTTMEELIRISGLSHGENVWVGNTRDIIRNGIAPLRDCICTRDDIMNSLMRMGVDSKMAFDTMESVRKGKGLTEAMEEAMIEAHTELWFIESCKKIKYMFPKAHAVAYVTMALRVAWYKVYHPTVYYAAFFTVRGDGFDAARMLVDADGIREALSGLTQQEQKLTGKEKQEIVAWELVLEMRMRGLTFLPCDLYKSDIRRFLIEDGHLRVPFTSLSGLGETAAQGIIRERGAAFVSVEDLRARAKLSASVIDLLRAHGCLSGLDESSQVSMFG